MVCYIDDYGYAKHCWYVLTANAYYQMNNDGFRETGIYNPTTPSKHVVKKNMVSYK